MIANNGTSGPYKGSRRDRFHLLLHFQYLAPLWRVVSGHGQLRGVKDSGE
jgi:hypothetical protein